MHSPCTRRPPFEHRRWRLPRIGHRLPSPRRCTNRTARSITPATTFTSFAIRANSAAGGWRHKDLDIWRIDRQAEGGWGEPQRLPEPANSRRQEWFPRPAADGWLYFGSGLSGGFGQTDTWRARQEADGAWQVEDADAAINTAGDEYEPLPSPDGKRMIVMASDGPYMTRFENGRWMPKQRLGSEVNVNGTEIGAVFSPSGKSLLFSRDTRGPLSYEFYLWQPDGPEAWPAACRDAGEPAT